MFVKTQKIQYFSKQYMNRFLMEIPVYLMIRIYGGSMQENMTNINMDDTEDRRMVTVLNVSNNMHWSRGQRV